jgi:hypothetical protein
MPFVSVHAQQHLEGPRFAKVLRYVNVPRSVKVPRCVEVQGKSSYWYQRHGNVRHCPNSGTQTIGWWMGWAEPSPQQYCKWHQPVREAWKYRPLPHTRGKEPVTRAVAATCFHLQSKRHQNLDTWSLQFGHMEPHGAIPLQPQTKRAAEGREGKGSSSPSRGQHSEIVTETRCRRKQRKIYSKTCSVALALQLRLLSNWRKWFRASLPQRGPAHSWLLGPPMIQTEISGKSNIVAISNQGGTGRDGGVGRETRGNKDHCISAT